MILAAVLAATFSFTATATGVEKGTPIEFLFAGKNSDRDYETMFLLDVPIDEFCRDLEKAGLPRGTPPNPGTCHLWPTGCKVKLNPAPTSYLEIQPDKESFLSDFIYTGGTRGGDERPDATVEMPAALFALYTIAQSPFLPNGIYPQGDVYGSCTAKVKLKKGDRITFTLNWSPTDVPRHLDLVARPNGEAVLIGELKAAAQKGEVDACIRFDESMTVAQATRLANALAVIDSVGVKINGCPDGGLFYRAFLPMVKWLDRKERLTQPFELTIGEPDRLVFIDEDWSVDGDDPKLTPIEINPSDIVKYTKTDTCFIFASPTTTVSRILAAKKELGAKHIVNWYVFAANNVCSHNRY